MKIKPDKLVFDIVCFLAAQGAGKDTQANLLISKLPQDLVAEISMSAVLRHYRKKDEEFDALIARLMARGKLVSDAIVIERLLMYIKEECAGKKFFVLNGFPRSAAQAFGLWAIGQKIAGIDLRICVIQLVLDLEKAFERCMGRRQKMIESGEPPREDDGPEEIRERLQTYGQNLPGVISALKLFAKVIEIDADQSVEVVESLVTAAVTGNKVHSSSCDEE